MQNNSSFNSFVFRRCLAFIYDTFLLIAVFFVVTSIVIAFNQGQAFENLAFLAVLYAVGFLFFSWFWRHGGQTLGMQAWRIKVISETNEPLTYKQCIKRYVIGTILFGITLVIALFRPSKQGLHDTYSNTKIVLINKELKD